jgi:hypothetical protein
VVFGTRCKRALAEQPIDSKNIIGTTKVSEFTIYE